MKTRLFIKLIFVVLTASLILNTACGGAGVKEGDKKESSYSDTGTAVIEFKNLEHDFGVITAGEKLAYVFTFTNTGTGSLIISSAATSCGCTVPQFSKKPLAPSQSGTLEVVFDSSGREGIQTKTITVQSNASVPVIILLIRADVKAGTR